MGNGDRHYSFCLKFFDEQIAQPNKQEKKPMIFAKDDISRKPLVKRRTAKEIWNKSSSTTLYRTHSQNAAYSDIMTKNDDPNGHGHPLGQLGTNLDEQLKFRQQQQPIQAYRSSSDPDSEIDLNTSELSAIHKLQSQTRRKMKVLERRNSSLILSSRKSSTIQSLEPCLPGDISHISLDDSELMEENRRLPHGGREKNSCFVVTKALVILSEFPYYQFFKDYLTQIYEYMVKLPKGQCEMIPIEQFISNLLYEVIVPPPGNDLCLEVHGPVSPLYLCSPSYNDLPLLDLSLEPLLLCLDHKNLITVFVGLTLERKFLFTSKNSNLLYHCTHALLSLLYPFEWQTGYVPVVPPNLLELTQALTPIILGVSSNYITQLEIPDEVSSQFTATIVYCN